MVSEDLGENYPFFKKEAVDEKYQMISYNEAEDGMVEEELFKRGRKSKSRSQSYWREQTMRKVSSPDEEYEFEP